jgi:hypothetical protein
MSLNHHQAGVVSSNPSTTNTTTVIEAVYPESNSGPQRKKTNVSYQQHVPQTPPTHLEHHYAVILVTLI